jgi:hypothetical protein
VSERTKTIDTWVAWAFAQERPYYTRIPRSIRDQRGLMFSPTQIEYTGGEGTAVHIERTFDGETGIPLARMGLPNQLTERRWGELYRALRQAGIPVYVVPRAVLENADVRRKSIEVLHSEGRRKFARPPQQLIRATVNPRWGRKSRVAYFLSGYDLNEKGLSYFFCELPPAARPTTVEEAYQALQPESVLRARAQRRKIKRQGDMFFIQAQGEEGPPEKSIVTDARLFDTNHYVSELARHNGLVMVRGRVFHNPSGRRPDHRAIRLPGKAWWIAVRNTVPVVKD